MVSITNEKLYDEFEKKLVTDKLIEKIEDVDVTPRFNSEAFDKWLVEPLELKLDVRGQLVTVTESGEEAIVFDPRGENLPEVTNYIPICPFDTQCGGIISQQQETRAAWKVFLVNKISNNVYVDEIEDIKLDYNFATFKNSKGEMPFFGLLAKIQQSKNFVISMLLSAINIKLSESIEKKGTPYIGIVSETEATALDQLKREVAVLNYEQSIAIRESKTRIGRHNIMNEYKGKLDVILESKTSNIRLLYRILMVDSDLIPFTKVVLLGRVADNLIKEMISNGRLTEDNEMNKKIRKNLVSRGKKQFLAEFRRSAFTKYSLGEREGLIPLV
jgi:hypothetical protein